MRLKIMEWNIQGSAALSWREPRKKPYEIKREIVDKVMEQDADIIVLTEFCISTGWDYFQKQLHDKYIWFMNYTSGKNGILICIKSDLVNLKALKDKIYKENPVFVNNEGCNILQISLPLRGGKIITVIGCRIEVDISCQSVSQKNYDERGKAFNTLLIPAVKRRLPSSDFYVVCGDFNNAYCWGNLREKFDPQEYFDHKNNKYRLQLNYNLNIIKDTFDSMGFTMTDIDENGGSIATYKGYPEDHIFVRGSVKVISCKTDPDDDLSEGRFSDHKIILAVVEVDV